jgi:ferredoxin
MFHITSSSIVYRADSAGFKTRPPSSAFTEYSSFLISIIIEFLVGTTADFLGMTLSRPCPSFSRLASITFVAKSGAKKDIAFEADQNLFEVLTGAGAIPSEGTCSGNLACGKCKISYVSGKITPAEDEEKELLAGEPARLACAIVLADEANGAVFKEI